MTLTKPPEIAGSNIARPHSLTAVPIWLLGILLFVAVVVACVFYFKTEHSDKNEFTNTVPSTPTKQIPIGATSNTYPQAEVQPIQQLPKPIVNAAPRPPVPGDLADAIRFAREKAAITGSNSPNPDAKPATSFLEAIRAAQQKQGDEPPLPNATALPFSKRD